MSSLCNMADILLRLVCVEPHCVHFWGPPWPLHQTIMVWEATSTVQQQYCIIEWHHAENTNPAITNEPEGRRAPFLPRTVYLLAVRNPVTVILVLKWRHTERDGVLNHQSHYCLLNRLWPVTLKMFPFDDVFMGHSPSYFASAVTHNHVS